MLVSFHGNASVYGHIQVGDNDLEIDFHNKHVIQGQADTLDLFGTDTKTNEMVNSLKGNTKSDLDEFVL